MTRTQILARVTEFLDRTGMSERQFGLAAVGNHKFVPRLRHGAGITLTVIERAEAFMAHRDEAGSQAGEAA